jgi:hypothetical protein
LVAAGAELAKWLPQLAVLEEAEDFHLTEEALLLY